MSRRVSTSLTDYVVVGINPALIMLLIASVIFFLVEVFYHGDYNLRLKFVFFMFIMGAVAVGRLSMEQGSGYAATFGFPLGIVAFLGINAFVTFEGQIRSYSPLINLLLIAFVWWLALQLTWDCTLLDERTDTADQGLLSALGTDTIGEDASEDEKATPAPADDTPATSTGRELAIQEDPVAWLQRQFERNRQPHAHGVWLLYFACLALPLFGFGGWFLSRDLASRQSAFGYLVLYVASSLALLLSTSFLGLRRYLRLRNVEMPLEMSGVWLTVGSVLILAVLLGCLVLPRPGAEVAMSRIPFPAITTERSPSKMSFGNDGKKQRDDARASSSDSQQTTPDDETKSPDDNNADKDADQQSGEEGQSGKAGADGKNAGNKQGSAGSGEKASGQQGQASQGSSQGSSKSQGGKSGSGSSKSGEKAGSEKNQSSASSKQQSSGDKNASPQEKQQSKTEQATRSENARQSQQQSSNPPRSSSSSMNMTNMLGWLGTLLKLVFWLGLAAVIGWYAWKHREELHAAWRKLLAEWRDLWERWFGSRDTAKSASDNAPAISPLASFSSFRDPFVSGQARTMAPRQLLQYTFAAVEAFGRECGVPRRDDETPHEYIERLSAITPQLDVELRRLVEAYARVAYFDGRVPASFVTPLQSLWKKWASGVEVVETNAPEQAGSTSL